MKRLVYLWTHRAVILDLVDFLWVLSRASKDLRFTKTERAELVKLIDRLA